MAEKPLSTGDMLGIVGIALGIFVGVWPISVQFVPEKIKGVINPTSLPTTLAGLFL